MEEVDLKEIVVMFWNKKIPMIVIIIMFIIVGFIYSVKYTTPLYKSSTTLVLASSEDDTSNTNIIVTATDLTVNSKLVSTYSELVKSKNILEEVSRNLEIQVNEQELRNYVTVNAVEDTELIEITATNINPDYAAQIANEVAKVFTQKVKEIYNIDNIKIVDEATVAKQPFNINPIKDILIFACMGLVIAVIYVIIANMLDTTIKTAQDVETAYDIPVLASIPMIKHLGDERK